MESDKDYKTFFIPKFEELYTTKGDPFSDKVNGNDHEYHDVRKLGHLLSKSNINFLEILYSKEVSYQDTLFTNLKMFRDDIAVMNLPYLYDSTVGTYFNALGQAQRSLSTDEQDITKFYKQIMNGARSLLILKRFADTGFKDFKTAISFLYGDSDYETLMYARLGKKDPQCLLDYANDLFKEVQADYKDSYKRHVLNEQTKERLEQTIRIHVKEHLKKELLFHETSV